MEKKQSKGILWRVLFVISALLMFAVLELGKHTVWGWILTALLLACFWFLRATRWKTFSAGKRILAWIGVLGIGFAAILWISWPPVQAVPAVKGAFPEKTGVIHVAQGDLTGVVTADGQVEVYAGIPYAQPPVGELRWKGAAACAALGGRPGGGSFQTHVHADAGSSDLRFPGTDHRLS
jgi:para-nitrobenzyl esterase